MTTGKHKILVTGAAGFIGSHLAETLAKDENNIVYATDIKSSCLDTVEPNLFVSRGIDLKKVTHFPDVDVIFHMAAFNGTKFFYEKPEMILDVAIKGLVNIFDGCIKHKIKELYLASSSEVYQTPNKIPTDEYESLKVPQIDTFCL